MRMSIFRRHTPRCLCHRVTQRFVVRLCPCPKGRLAIGKPLYGRRIGKPVALLGEGMTQEERKHKTGGQSDTERDIPRAEVHGLLSCRITSMSSQEIGRVLCYKTAEKYRQPQKNGQDIPEGELTIISLPGITHAQRRIIATALTLTLTLSAPFTALSQTAPAAEELRARAKLEADGIKSKALSRLQTEATYIPEGGKSSSVPP